MNELWFFITGNFINAIIFSIAAVFFLLSIGAVLAAWLSILDESQYNWRIRKLDADVVFGKVLSKYRPSEMKEVSDQQSKKAENLTWLKTIATGQAKRYGKFAVIYFALFVAFFGAYSMSITKDVQKHELAASEVQAMLLSGEEKENVKIKTVKDKITVSVFDKTKNANYEYIYSDNGETKEYGQKSVQIPTILTNLAAILWLLMIWGTRYIRSII